MYYFHGVSLSNNRDYNSDLRRGSDSTSNNRPFKKLGGIEERPERLESPLLPVLASMGVSVSLEVGLGLHWKLGTLDKPFGFQRPFVTIRHTCIYSKFVLPTRKSLEIIINNKNKIKIHCPQAICSVVCGGFIQVLLSRLRGILQSYRIMGLGFDLCGLYYIVCG